MKTLKLTSLCLALMTSGAGANVFVADNYGVSNLNQDVIEERLSMAGPLFNGWERTYRQGDPWVEAYGYNNRIKNVGGFGKIKSRGAVASLGYDHVIAENFRLGLAFNGGASRLKSEGLGGHSNAANYGINLYSTWTGKKVNVIANLGYTHGKADNKFDLYDLSDAKTKAFNAGLRFETSFIAGGISFVPYYGVRFTHLSSDSMHLQVPGASASLNFGNANIWQFPVGVNAGYEYTCAAGWKSRSMIDLSIVPTAGDRKVSTKFADITSLDTRFADSVQYRAKVGLQVSKKQHSFGFLYGVAAAAHGSVDQNVKLNYQFMY